MFICVSFVGDMYTTFAQEPTEATGGYQIPLNWNYIWLCHLDECWEQSQVTARTVSTLSC